MKASKCTADVDQWPVMSRTASISAARAAAIEMRALGLLEHRPEVERLRRIALVVMDHDLAAHLAAR